MTDKHTDTFFDLTREGWLPCLDREGKPLHQLLGLREIFAQAHELRDINGDSPLVDAALYRLLLAILHRNFQNTVTKRWKELWDYQKFDMRTLDAYFDEWQDQKQRFFLYHPTHPFFQSPKAYGGGDHGQLFDKGVADLMQEVASGDKPTLFNHTIYHKDVDEGNFALSLPEAARLLIAIEAYKLPGTGAKTDIGARASFETAPLVDGILFVARGRTLFETLMLNLLEITNGDPFLQQLTDCPCWERDDPFAARNIPDGYIDYLTWQGCRTLLEPAKQTEVGYIVYKMKLSLGLTKLDSTARKRDPMKAFDADSEGRPVKAVKWKSGRSLWRDSAALFNLKRIRESRSDKAKLNRLPPRILENIAELPLDKEDRTLGRYRCVALGLLNDDASIEFYRREEMPLPPDYLTRPYLVERLDKALKLADQVSEKLKEASTELLDYLIEIKGRREGDDIKKRRETMHGWIEQRYWPNLTQPFYEYLNRLRDTNDLDAEVTRWRVEVTRIARRALEGVGAGLGDSARAYKARVRAAQKFEYALNRLK